MLSLRETQQRFARAVLGKDDGQALIVADWLQPAQRMRIYRYHFTMTLCEALATSFSVVSRLVGEDFFNEMAKVFIAAHPPSWPCLAEYGAVFPDFISSFEPARSLPYLTDIALFEWLMNQAMQNADFVDNAFYSPYPLGRMWETNQPDYEGDDTVNLDEGGGWFLVEKKQGRVFWRMLALPPDVFDQSGSHDQ
jgi:hypothetical protein